jgi:MSHA biogenesis protein MshJ
MKQRWIKLAARINALTVRERVLVFAASAAAIVFVAHALVLGPLLRKQAALRAQVSQQQNNLAGIDGEITQKVQAYENDPDAPVRARLATVKAETAQLGESLRAMQKGLVPPERMAPLLDTILRANGRLQLVSMKTLPVGSVNDLATAGTAQAEPASRDGKSVHDAAKAAAPTAVDMLYRHGVEISVRGNYLDLVDYMGALESMPTQLFWGKALLEVEEYPNSRLTLTLYTLSLDPKWMKL